MTQWSDEQYWPDKSYWMDVTRQAYFLQRVVQEVGSAYDKLDRCSVESKYSSRRPLFGELRDLLSQVKNQFNKALMDIEHDRSSIPEELCSAAKNIQERVVDVERFAEACTSRLDRNVELDGKHFTIQHKNALKIIRQLDRLSEGMRAAASHRVGSA